MSRKIVKIFTASPKIISLLAISPFIVSCGSDNSSDTQPTEETSTYSSEATVSSEPTDIVASTQISPAEPIAQLAWSSQSGYEYEYILEAGTVDAEIDILNAAPGRALIVTTINIDTKLLNKTPNRNAPFPANLSIRPMWSLDKNICNEDFPRMKRIVSTGGSDTGYCVLRNATPTLPRSEDHAERGIYSNYHGMKIDVDSYIALTSESVSEYGVDEELAEAYRDEIASPDGWVLTGPTFLSTCKLTNGDEMGDTESDYVYATSFDIGCVPEE